MKPFLIGLAGLSGAGKSTLADHLEAQGGVKRFRLDAYYKDECECPQINGRPHWDLPGSLHMDRVAEALRDLQEGNDIFLPIYSRRENRQTGQMLFQAAPVIFAEGLMLFSDARLRELFDLRLWLEVTEEIALQRRLQRQPDYDLNYYRNVALPAAREFVAPHRSLAQEIIDGTQTMNEVAEQTDEIIHKYLGL